MGLGPLDWLDSHRWGRAVRTLAEGSQAAADRVWVDTHGFMSSINMQLPDALDQYEKTVIGLVTEDAYMRGAVFDRSLMAQTGIDQNAAISVMKWLQTGAQTFDFEGALADELMETEVGDVPMNDVVLPYSSIYIRLRNSATDENGLRYDGFLVERRESPISSMIGVTPIKRQGKEYVASMLCCLPYGEDQTVADALLGEVRRLGAGNTPIMVGGTNVKMSASLVHLAMPSGGNNGYTVTQGLQNMKEAVLTLDAILPLIVNTLLYIDSCRSHIRKGWPTGAPDKIAARAIAAPVGATKARDTLIRANWREAHLCTLQAEIEAGGVIGEMNPVQDLAARRTHWRRGHWRMQVHGPARSLRRRMRIRATIVGRRGAVTAEDRKYGVKMPIADGSRTT